MGTQLYQLPLIYQPLRPAESIHQAIDSLINLNNFVNDLLQKVQGKITSEKERLDNISSRVAAAETKVQSLRNTTQATTVISPCSYPVSDDHRAANVMKPIFAPPVPVRHRSNFHLQNDIDAHLPSGFVDDPLDTKLADYRLQSRETFTEPRRGLGQLPYNISSVTSLLLFNTNECPYKEYSFIDNLRRQDRKLKASAQDIPLEEAETSFYEFTQGTDRDEIMYRPVHEDMPDVRAALPSQLSGYGNIAANVGFLSNKEKQSQAIAPTAIPLDLDLPEVPNATPTPAPTTQPATTQSPTPQAATQPASTPQATQQAAVAQTPQPATQGPTPPAQKEPIAQTAAPNDGSGEMKRSRAPPAPRGGRGGRGGPAKSIGKAPAPRGGPAKDLGGKKKGKEGASKKKAAAKADDGDLMSAIKNGVTLKSKDAPRETKKKGKKKGEDEEPEKPAPPEPGNLFADLVGALMRRRDAFTGEDDSDKNKKGGKSDANKRETGDFEQEWEEEQ